MLTALVRISLPSQHFVCLQGSLSIGLVVLLPCLTRRLDQKGAIGHRESCLLPWSECTSDDQALQQLRSFLSVHSLDG